MSILVIGGCGFIGSHVVDKLLEKGYEVKVMGLSCHLENLKHVEDKIEFVKSDIKNIEDVKNVIYSDTEGIMHFAALINVDQSLQAPYSFLRTNVIGTFNVLEAARLKEIPKIFYMSTCEVYGNIDKGKADENHPTNPRSPYAASKFAAERYLLSYSYSYRIPAIKIVRGFNIFGPRQSYGQWGAVIPKFITTILDDKKIRIFGDGSQTRDYVFVKDIAEGTVAIYEKDLPSGEIINLATGNEISIRQIAEKICKLAGKDFEENVEFVEGRPGELVRSCGDYSKAKKILNWEPKFSFDKGLAETFEWYKRNYKKS